MTRGTKPEPEIEIDDEVGDEVDDEVIVALSDYLDGALPADRTAEVEGKIASDPTWKTAHAELVDTRTALSGLQKARAPESFAQDVTATIHKRSAGAFFARRTLGDRVPIGVLLMLALAILAGVAYVMWSSPTGSLKVERERPAVPRGSGAIVDHP